MGKRRETFLQPDDNKMKMAIIIFNSINTYVHQLHTSNVNNKLSATICRIYCKIYRKKAGKHEVNYLLSTIFFQMCSENYLGSSKNYWFHIKITSWKSYDKWPLNSQTT